MTSTLAMFWTALTRPRYRGRGRQLSGRRSGVAILVVVVAIMIMTVIVTELAYGARVRLLTAAHARDRIQAEWLARSGYNIYRLILVANKDLARNKQLQGFADMLGVNLGDALWQMIPVLNTGLIRMLMGSGGDMSDLEDEELAEFQQSGKVKEEYAEASREDGGLFSDKNFLDFHGDFSVEVRDHESQVYINGFQNDNSVHVQESATAQQLYSLMSGEEADQWFHDRAIDRWEVIGNLKDWVDTDTYRSSGLGGFEDNLYNVLDSPYLCKNAPFDTKDEVRLVDGWQAEVFDKYSDQLTVYGKEGKININTADEIVMRGLIRSCASGGTPSDHELDQCIETLEEVMLFETFDKGTEFADAVTTNCGIEMDRERVNSSVTFSSQTFTVTSTGLVGTSAVTITAVLDFSGNVHEGDLLHWRVQ